MAKKGGLGGKRIFSLLFLISGTELIGKERGTWGNRGTKGD
jgi:hypothetical protein